MRGVCRECVAESRRMSSAAAKANNIIGLAPGNGGERFAGPSVDRRRIEGSPAMKNLHSICVLLASTALVVPGMAQSPDSYVSGA